MALPASPAPVCILSLDGGGIRGYSSLQILEQVMLQIQSELNLLEVPKPCDYFDLIGGTSTGGIIAILLGRLRLSVADALKAYDSVASQAFVPRLFYTPTGGKYRADSLKKVIQDVVKDKDGTRDPEAIFVDLEAPKTVVLSITTVDVSSGPTLFRSYDTDPSWLPCKIWEIARAASAAYSYFEAITIGRDHITCMDSAFGYNNPCVELVKESRRSLQGRPIGCILSIGTGLSRAVDASNIVSVAKALVDMATSSKNVHREMQVGEYRDVYFRLDETLGVSEIKLDNYKKMGALAGLTKNYLRQPDTEKAIKLCVDSILSSRRDAIADEPLYFEVDYPENSKFVRQIDALQYLQTKFPESEQTQIRRAVIYGMGGMGKTQIALDYAHISQPKQSVFWINADTRGSLEQRVKEILGSVDKIAPLEHPDQYGLGRAGAVIRTFRRWLESEHSGWLLILDNVSDSRLIADLLPTRGHGDILCTTRNQSIVGSDIFPGKGYKLQAMLERDAITVFLNRLLADLDYSNSEIQLFLDEFQATSDPNDVNAQIIELLSYLNSEYGILKFSELQEITTLVGRLPLGLVQSAAYMSAANYRVTFSDYKKRLQASGKRREAFFKFDLTSSYDQNLWSVWKLNFDQIKKRCPEAGDLINLIAFLDRSSLTQKFLSSALDERKYWDGKLVFKMSPDNIHNMVGFLPFGEEGADLANSLSELSKLSLLDTSSTIEIHKLVQEYTVLQMSREEYGRFLGYSVAILTQNLPPLLYSRNDNMAPSLSQQALSHVGRLGQVIREHIRQPELDPALKREIALLFLTTYRWNWDPEDLDLAIDMTRNEQPDDWLVLLINSSRLFLEVSKEMQDNTRGKNREKILVLKADLLRYGGTEEPNRTSGRKPARAERSWATVASTLRDYGEPIQMKSSSFLIEQDRALDNQGLNPTHGDIDIPYQFILKDHFDHVRRFLFEQICQWALDEEAPESIGAISQAVLLACFWVEWEEAQDLRSQASVARVSSAMACLDLGLDEIQGFDRCYFKALERGYGSIEECLRVVEAFYNTSLDDCSNFGRIPFPYMLERYTTETMPVWMEIASNTRFSSTFPWPLESFHGPALIALRAFLLVRLNNCMGDLQNMSTALRENTGWLCRACDWKVDEQDAEFNQLLLICQQLQQEYDRIPSPLESSQQDHIEFSDQEHKYHLEGSMLLFARLFATTVSDLLAFYETCYKVALQTYGIHDLETQQLADKILSVYRLKAEKFEQSVVQEIDAVNERSTWAKNWLLKFSSTFKDLDIGELIAMERHGYALENWIICARSTEHQLHIIWTRSSTLSKPLWDVIVDKSTLLDSRHTTDNLRILQAGADTYYFNFFSHKEAESFSIAFAEAGGILET